MNTIVHESPVGRLTLTSDGEKLASVWFENHRLPMRPDAERAVSERREDAVLRQARRELDEYFAGKRTQFSVPLAPRGGTAFQRRVWDALAKIPFGATATYGSVAQQIGASTAVRAVGGAVGANPLPIVIPCHRVVGARGALTGFGGGLERKRLLLTIEGHTGL